MHEYSLARGLLRQLDELQLQHRAERIVSIKLRVGEFSGIDADLLELAIEELTINGPWTGLSVDIKHIELSVLCEDCRCQQPVERFRFQCRECSSTRVTIVGGQDLMLDSATMEYES